MDAWRGFKSGDWQNNINVSDFIKHNYTEYTGDEAFLEGPTENTKKLWDILSGMLKIEREKGIYDAETKIPSKIDAYGAGYIDKNLETIVGLQTDAPLKRAIFPNGGLRMVENSLEAFGYKLDPTTKEIYEKYRKSHNAGVFSAYTPAIKAARHTGIITGLPDAYGRGRIIGDYRRVALYGVDRLIAERKREFDAYDPAEMTEDVIRDREEMFEQLEALKALKRMAAAYGFDIGRPAETAQEAVQWTYFGYLGAIKDQNGAAMSLGKTAGFLDVYIERDLKEGRITEKQAQEEAKRIEEAQAKAQAEAEEQQKQVQQVQETVVQENGNTVTEVVTTASGLTPKEEKEAFEALERARKRIEKEDKERAEALKLAEEQAKAQAAQSSQE